MTASDPSNPSPRRRALIAEDDESLRRMLRELLESEGYAVEAFGDGAEVLARARAAPPDLIVTDAIMPRPATSFSSGTCAGATARRSPAR